MVASTAAWTLDSSVLAASVLTALNGVLYVGGEFTSAGGTEAGNIASWDGKVWKALGEGTDATIESLAVKGTALYVGGEFSKAGGAPAQRIARWAPI